MFELPPGTYPYTASCFGKTWQGSITIQQNGCSLLELKADQPNVPPATTGQATFWIASDLACGNITVTINGLQGSITGFYTSGSPNCGSSHTATFNLPPGNYSWTAKCSKYSWNGGSIAVTAGKCNLMQLTR